MREKEIREQQTFEELPELRKFDAKAPGGYFPREHEKSPSGQEAGGPSSFMPALPSDLSTDDAS